MKFSKYKLGELLRVTRGASLAGTGYADAGRYLRLTLANFNEEGGFKDFKSTQGKYFTDSFDRRFLMRKGDLITPLTEQSPGLLGSVAFIPCDDLYIQSQDVGLITCNPEKLDKTFAYYLFLTHSVREQISARSQQTKIRHTSPDKISDIEVYIPDLPTQLRIAGVLGSLDEKIALNRKKIAELEALAKTIYDYWFVQFDFPNKDGKPYKSSGGKMVWNEQLKREVPEGWEAGTVADLGDIVAGGTPSTSNPEFWAANGIAWITPKDLAVMSNKYIRHGEHDISEEGLHNSSAQLMPRQSILLSTRAPIGYLAIADRELCTNQGFKSIIPNKRFGSEFIYYTISALVPYIKTLGVGSTFAEVSKSTFASLRLVLPTHSITERFDAIVSSIGHARLICELELEETVLERDSLLPLLMNGQVVVK
jgi:type I restriction enzyme S subunit